VLGASLVYAVAAIERAVLIRMGMGQ
jgi:hypothetical protein